MLEYFPVVGALGVYLAVLPLGVEFGESVFLPVYFPFQLPDLVDAGKFYLAVAFRDRGVRLSGIAPFAGLGVNVNHDGREPLGVMHAVVIEGRLPHLGAAARRAREGGVRHGPLGDPLLLDHVAGVTEIIVHRHGLVLIQLNTIIIDGHLIEAQLLRDFLPAEPLPEIQILDCDFILSR
jgi:hypothetical protein